MSDRRTRRAVLGGLGALALAGCLSDGEGPATDPDGTPSPTPASTGSGTGGSPTATDIGDNSATVTDTPRPPDPPETTTGPVAEPPDTIDSEWPVPAADPGLSNRAAEASGPTGELGSLWRVFDDTTFATPVLADGTVYVGDDDGTVRALDGRTGEERWEQSVGTSAGSPWAVGDRLFVPTADGVAALARSDGSESLRVETPDCAAVLVATHGIYWIDATGPAVVALERGDGSERWRTSIDDPWDPTVFTDGASVFVSSGTHDSRFWRLSVETGDIEGEEPRRGADFPAEQCYVDGAVYAVDAFFGTVRATPVDGDESGWSQSVPPGGRGGGQLSAGTDRVYYTANVEDEPGLTALSTADGRVEWERDVDPRITGRPVVAEAAVLVPTADGLRCYDPADGDELWDQPDVGGGVIVADDVVYAAWDGTVRAFRPL